MKLTIIYKSYTHIYVLSRFISRYAEIGFSLLFFLFTKIKRIVTFIEYGYLNYKNLKAGSRRSILQAVPAFPFFGGFHD